MNLLDRTIRRPIRRVIAGHSGGRGRQPARWVSLLALATLLISSFILGGSVGAPPAFADNCPGGTVSGPTCTYTFSFVLGGKTWFVPAGVTEVTIVADGAIGGRTRNYIPPNCTFCVGALGGQETGTFTVAPGELLQVEVGQEGLNDSLSNGLGGGASFGGGGTGDNSDEGGGGVGGALSSTAPSLRCSSPRVAAEETASTA